MRHRRIDGPLRGAPLVSQRPFGDSTDRAGCPEWVLSTRLPFGACHTGGWCSTYWVMSGGASGRDRSKEVFEQLYDRVARRLLVYLTRRMHDVDAATELWAECWAVAFEGWPRCNAASASEADAWVFGIARNQLAGYYRSGAIKHRALHLLTILLYFFSSIFFLFLFFFFLFFILFFFFFFFYFLIFIFFYFLFYLLFFFFFFFFNIFIFNYL